MGWSSGPPRMVEGEADLEEGEAAVDDDKSIDLERDLSYLDEKVQSVLGHFQKDFEGGLSAEDLGATYGGYGSFLPTYQRAPIKSQPKSPQRVQIHSNARSPISLRRETLNHFAVDSIAIQGSAQTATALPDVPFSQRKGTAATCGMQTFQEIMVPSADSSVRQDSSLASAPVGEKFPKKHQQATDRPVVVNEKRTLKFRIKVGSDKGTQKNAAIYSGLGLTSPSSSTGNSLGESEGNLFGSRETPGQSLSSILQMLTSVVVTGGLLVSPLRDHFLSFNSKFPKESKPGATIMLKRNKSATSADDSTSLSREDLLTKKPTEVRKSDMRKEAKYGNGKAFEDDMHSRLKDSSGAQMLQNKQSLASDVPEKRTSESVEGSAKAIGTSRECDDGALSSKRGVSKATMKDRDTGNELVNGESLESISGQNGGKFNHREAKGVSLQLAMKKERISSQKDLPSGYSEGPRANAQINPASVRGDTDVSEGEGDCKGHDSLLMLKPRMKTSSSEQGELRMVDTDSKFSLENKKNSKRAEVKGRVSSNSVLISRKAGVSVVVKEKGIKRDSCKVYESREDLLETNSQIRNKGVDMLEANTGGRVKELKLDTVKEKNAHDRSKEKLKKFDDSGISGSLLKDPPSVGLLPNTGPILGGEQAASAPVLIEEHWVCCDSCQKWRLLPFGMKPEDLPEKWLCRMLNWLPGMNRCDISEEETTKALQALSQLPPPENQPGFQVHADKSASGVYPVDQQLVNHNNQNLSIDHMHTGRKKIHKAKDSVVPFSKVKNFQQDVVKRESSKDGKQQLLASKTNYIPSSHHSNKPEIVVKKEHSDRQNLDFVTGGDAKPKKKVKRELDQEDHEIQKRIKTENASTIENFHNSTPCHGRLRFSLNNIPITRASIKDEDYFPKELKFDARNGLQSSTRKSRNDASGLPDTEQRGMVRKSNDKEKPSKKRKLKDGRNDSEILPSEGSQLCDRNVAVKEESSDIGFTRNKKPRVLQTDGKDSGRNKCTPDLKRMKTRVKIPSQITMEDLESLKKDLGCDPVSTAATSSSSKVSDSRKTRSSYQEMKGSPVESVSSSPIRMFIRNKLSPKSAVLGLDDSKAGEFPANRSHRNFVAGDGNYVSKRNGMPKKRQSSNVLQPEANDNPLMNLLGTGAEDKFRGESKVGIEPSTLHGNSTDNNPDLLEGHSPYPLDLRASQLDKDRTKIQGSIHGISLKASSFPKDKKCNLNSLGALETACDQLNAPGVLNLRRSSKVETETLRSHGAASGVANDAKQTFLDQSGYKSAKGNENGVKRESRKLPDGSRDDIMQAGERTGSGLSNSGAQVTKNLSTKEDCGSAKSKVDHHSEDDHEVSASKSTPETLNGSHLHVQSHDVSTFNEVPKLSKDPSRTVNQNEPRKIIGRPVPDQHVVQDTNRLDLSRKDVSCHVPLALKEAEELRRYADQIKVSGFVFECNETYFQAALKFLHGASLLENDSYRELNQIQIYLSAAKLFESCAHEYEQQQEMAPAALTYKCMEVAYMKVVYCKSSNSSKHWHELQASLQNATQGESPSSSASDIDHLNNQVVVEKAPLSKSDGSSSGSHVIAPKNRPNFVRLLDFTKDVNSAMEASEKSQNAFVAANLILEKAKNEEGKIALKRVIDFNFQDVEEFVHLVRIAVESISRKGFGGSRD
ncbi:OLC1v1020380C3 [Oldenlandia corymbosa var. corymbosa]|uniref:OLC1v1020380C3 n=1 Tax=Oldenlandia corymbosa var. corymbosa TaxID=529605 RepID=A0AAV1EGJ9_OLDCO|nr:OLC1v1020380C3 [Oldenlandia corymbosa var. corymbosa]